MFYFHVGDISGIQDRNSTNWMKKMFPLRHNLSTSEYSSFVKYNISGLISITFTHSMIELITGIFLFVRDLFKMTISIYFPKMLSFSVGYVKNEKINKKLGHSYIQIQGPSILCVELLEILLH